MPYWAASNAHASRHLVGGYPGLDAHVLYRELSSARFTLARNLKRRGCHIFAAVSCSAGNDQLPDGLPVCEVDQRNLIATKLPSRAHRHELVINYHSYRKSQTDTANNKQVWCKSTSSTNTRALAYYFGFIQGSAADPTCLTPTSKGLVSRHIDYARSLQRRNPRRSGPQEQKCNENARAVSAKANGLGA